MKFWSKISNWNGSWSPIGVWFCNLLPTFPLFVPSNASQTLNPKPQASYLDPCSMRPWRPAAPGSAQHQPAVARCSLPLPAAARAHGPRPLACNGTPTPRSKEARPEARKEAKTSARRPFPAKKKAKPAKTKLEKWFENKNVAEKSWNEAKNPKNKTKLT